MIERTPEDPAALLRAYDEQLRRDAEVQGADVVTEDGPLVRGVFSWGGFVSYRDLDGVDDLDALIAQMDADCARARGASSAISTSSCLARRWTRWRRR